MPESASVYLNHILIFVDSETYRAIVASPFLRERFAVFEERTTHDRATGMSWTGCYGYGQHTYFEFMRPDATSWMPRDGIAFGVEQPEAENPLAEKLSAGLQTEVRQYPRTRQYGDRAIPWFRSVEIKRDAKEALTTWIMIYQPEFLAEWETHLPPEHGGVAREDILTRYRARVNDGKGEERLFKDIAEITVALPEPEAERLRCELNLYGYGITQEQNGFLLTGPDIRIRIESDKQDRYGVQSVIMKTKSYAGTSTHRIGTGCVLTLPGEGLAEWTLGTPG